MSEANFGIRLTADGKQLVGEVKGAREEIDALKKSTDALSSSTQSTAQQTKSYWVEQQQAANASAAAWLKGNAAADAAADKAWALGNGYKQVGDQILKTGTESAKAMGGLGLNTQHAHRAMAQLGKEAMTGDFSRMPGTFASLVTHSNILPALISPIGLAVAGVTVAAAAGAIAWYRWGESAREAMEKASSAAKDARADLKAATSGVTPTDEELLRNLQWKLDAASGELSHALAQRSKITRETDALEAQTIGQTVIDRRATVAALERQVDQLQSSMHDAASRRDEEEEKRRLKAARDSERPEISEQKRYEALTRSTADRIAALQAEAQQTDRLSEAEKQLAIFNAQAAAGTAGLTAEHIKARRAQLESALAAEQLTEAHRAELKAREDNLKGLESGTASIRKQTEAAKYETSIIGETKEQIALLQAQRGEHTIAIMEERLAVLDATGACTAESEALRDQIKARQELKAALGDRASAEAKHAAIEEEKKAYVEMWRTIEHTGKDVFVQVLSNGKSAFESIGKALKASVIDLLYQMTLKRWIINISAVGGTTAGGSAFASGGSAAGGMDIPWGGSSMIGSGISWLGGATGSAGLSAFGTGMGLTASQAAAASGAYSAAGMSSVGSSLTAGSMIGAALPYVGAALAIYSLLKGNGGTPTANTGNAAMQFDASGRQIGRQTYYGGSSASTDAMITGMQATYAQTAAALGIGTTVSQFNYGGNTGRNGQSPNFALGGGAGGVNFYQPETPLSEAAVQLAASRAVFAALQGSELPDYLKGVFDNLNASTATKEQIDNTLAFAASLKELRQQLAGGLVDGMRTLLGLADQMASLYLSDLSPLTAAERLAQAGGQYATLLAQARAGDLGAVDRLGGAAQTYLQEGRSYYASSQDYTALFDNVQSAVGDLVDTQITDSAVAITDLKVPLEAIVSNTQNLDRRIADILAAALAARAETDAAVIRAQTEAIVRATLDAARVTVSAQQAGALA